MNTRDMPPPMHSRKDLDRAVEAEIYKKMMMQAGNQSVCQMDLKGQSVRLCHLVSRNVHSGTTLRIDQYEITLCTFQDTSAVSHVSNLIFLYFCVVLTHTISVSCLSCTRQYTDRPDTPANFTPSWAHISGLWFADHSAPN